MIIPWQALEKDTLAKLIEQFVLIEGTEYGMHDVALETKIEQVHQQLQQGDAVIVWSEEQETAMILSKQQVQQWMAEHPLEE